METVGGTTQLESCRTGFAVVLSFRPFHAAHTDVWVVSAHFHLLPTVKESVCRRELKYAPFFGQAALCIFFGDDFLPRTAKMTVFFCILFFFGSKFICIFMF